MRPESPTPDPRRDRARPLARVFRGAWRVLCGLLWTLFVLVAVFLTALALVRVTPAGRAWVLEMAVEQVNALIPGRISVGRMDRLGFGGIDLAELRAYDPQGTEVIRLAEVAIDTDWSGLIRGDIALSRVQLHSAWVDLRVLEERRGLLATFVDPDAPPSPPSGPGPGPTVLISGIDLEAIVARLPPIPSIGQLDVHLGRLRGAFTMRNDQIGGGVETLELHARRAERELLALSLSGAMSDDATASHLVLDARSGPAVLHFRASGVLPTQKDWDTEPLKAEIDLRGVTAAHLAEVLRDPAFEDAFLGDMALSLAAQGTPLALVVDGALKTAGGTLVFNELSARDLRSLRAVLSTDGIALDQVRDGLPAHRVALELVAEVHDLPPQPVDFSLRIRKASLDDEPLVDLDVKGRYHEDLIEDLLLTAHEGDSRLKAEGQIQLSGAADLSLQADLRPALVQRLARLGGQELQGHVTSQAQVERRVDGHLVAQGSLTVDDLRQGPPRANDTGKPPAAAELLQAKKLAARFDVAGIPPALRGTVSATLKDARLGERVLDEAELRVEGGLAAVEVRLDAAGGYGLLDEAGGRPEKDSAELHLSARVERGARHTRISGEGSGKVQGKGIVLDLEPTTIADTGRVHTDGIELAVAGHGVRIRGEVAPQGESSGLDVQFGPLSLQAVDETLGLGQRLVGEVKGKAHLAGSIAVPRLTFEVSGNNVGVSRKPLAQLTVSGTVDAQAGQAEVHLTAKGQTLEGKPGLSTELSATLTAPSGAKFLEGLPRGETAVTLAVQRLESEFVKPYLPPGVLPLDALLAAQLDVHGPLADLALTSHSQITLRLSERPPVSIEHDLGYEDGQVDTRLRVQDGRGPFLDAMARLLLKGPPPSAQDMGAAFAEALPNGTWEVHVQTQKRALAELDVLSLVLDPKSLPPVALDLALDATHEPMQEPVIDLVAHVAQAEAQSLLPGEACDTGNLQLKIEARHRQLSNQLTIQGLAGDKTLLSLEAGVPLALAPLLAGGKPDLGPIDVRARSEALAIAELPVFCNQGQGTLTLQLEGQDLMGKEPSLLLDLHAANFSLGGSHRLDLNLTAEADQRQLSATLELDGLSDELMSHSLGTKKAARQKKRQKKRQKRANQNAQSTTSQLEAEDKGQAKGLVKLRIPWTFSEGKLALPDDAPLYVSVNLDSVPLSPLVPAKGPVSYVRGEISADLTARGKLKAPLIDGELTLKDVAFTSTSLAQPLRGIQGRLLFAGRKLRIEHLEAHDRDGVLNLKGDVDLSNLDKVHARVEIQAHEFPLRQQGQVVAVTELDAVAETTVTADKTEARLTLRDVDTWLESVAIRTGIQLKAHPEFVINGRAPEGSKTGTEQAHALSQEADNKTAPSMSPSESNADEATKGSAKGRTSQLEVDDEQGQLIHIVIEADQRFWVKRKDFAVKLSTVLDTRIKDDAVRVNGEVVIDRGYLQLFGKVFDLARESKLRFIGSNPPNPVLELEAKHKTRNGSTVSVTISGRAEAPVLQFFIDGQQVEAGLAVQELFGGQKSGDDSDATNQARSFIGGLTAGVLATAARRELGAAAPILMIDPSDEAGEGSVRAGFELDDIVPEFLKPIITGVYLEGVVARGADGGANTNTQFGALLEFYFPKKFFTAGQYGPGTTWSLDFGWQL